MTTKLSQLNWETRIVETSFKTVFLVIVMKCVKRVRIMKINTNLFACSKFLNTTFVFGKSVELGGWVGGKVVVGIGIINLTSTPSEQRQNIFQFD